jgi:NDP-sugar pyrophosphorylase family protein
MMAVILAGGKGTRLHPFTVSIPKPLLPLGDVPILEIVLAQLRNAGVTRVVVTLGHLPHLFAACIGDGSRFGLTIEYCQEEHPLGTAGSLLLVKQPEEAVLVMNGDLLTTINYGELLRFHYQQGAAATIAVHRRSMYVDYGVIETTVAGQLDRYIEKPSIPYLVSMGINVVSRESLRLIPPGEKFDMPQLMLAIKSSGKTVNCYETDCYWQDIGRFDDFQKASADFAADPDRFLKIDYGPP